MSIEPDSAADYRALRNAVDEARRRRVPPWIDIPQWGQFVLTMAATLVALTLLYGKIDTRLSVLETKMDLMLNKLAIQVVGQAKP